MKQHNYKAGDKVRIVQKNNRPTHHFSIGEIAEVRGVKMGTGSLHCVNAKHDQYVNPDDVELVEADKPAIFDRDDIKAGYLLAVKEDGTGVTFYMTVVPTKYSDPDDHLGCCSPNKDWWPLTKFDNDTLTYYGRTIMRVYGPTTNKHLLDNTPEDRELLWERKKKPEAVEMTVAEISEKLGYEVKIVKEK